MTHAVCLTVSLPEGLFTFSPYLNTFECLSAGRGAIIMLQSFVN